MKAFFDMMHEGPHKVMLFGAACTQVTDPIAKASKHWRITQVNNIVIFAQSSPSLSFHAIPAQSYFFNFFNLSFNEHVYYFMNVCRVTKLYYTIVS